MVRLYGGCSDKLCAGALITSKHVLTTYRCAIKSGETKPCDHSDGEEDRYMCVWGGGEYADDEKPLTPGKRMAILGQNTRSTGSKSEGTRIPIIGL